jgi:hypothetical protein
MLVIAPIDVCGYHLRFFKCAHAKRIAYAKQKSEFPLDTFWM